MRELNLVEIEQVAGGRIMGFFSDYFWGKAVDVFVDAVMSGQIDYAGTVEANSSYCAIGA